MLMFVRSKLRCSSTSNKVALSGQQPATIIICWGGARRIGRMLDPAQAPHALCAVPTRRQAVLAVPEKNTEAKTHHPSALMLEWGPWSARPGL